MVAFLKSLGDADPVPVPKPLEPADLAACTGLYEMDRPGGGRLEISAKEGALYFKRLPDGASRSLVHLGSRAFHPVGARAVRISFTPAGPVAANLRVVDGPEVISALRLPG